MSGEVHRADLTAQLHTWIERIEGALAALPPINSVEVLGPAAVPDAHVFLSDPELVTAVAAPASDDAVVAMALALSTCSVETVSEAMAFQKVMGRLPTGFSASMVFGVLRGIGLVHDPGRIPRSRLPLAAATNESGFAAHLVAQATAINPLAMAEPSAPNEPPPREVGMGPSVEVPAQPAVAGIVAASVKPTAGAVGSGIGSPSDAPSATCARPIVAAAGAATTVASAAPALAAEGHVSSLQLDGSQTSPRRAAPLPPSPAHAQSPLQAPLLPMPKRWGMPGPQGLASIMPDYLGMLQSHFHLSPHRPQLSPRATPHPQAQLRAPGPNANSARMLSHVAAMDSFAAPLPRDVQGSPLGGAPAALVAPSEGASEAAPLMPLMLTIDTRKGEAPASGPSPHAASPRSLLGLVEDDSLTAEVKALAESGRFDDIAPLGAHAVEAALVWVFHQSAASLPAQVFTLAREGQFEEMEDRFGPAVVEAMLGWACLKGDEWAALRRKRAKSLGPREQRTVEHVMLTVLKRPLEAKPRNGRVALSALHDAALGPGCLDPCVEVPLLEREHSHLLREEEELLERLCAASGVIMPPGRAKADAAAAAAAAMGTAAGDKGLGADAVRTTAQLRGPTAAALVSRALRGAKRRRLDHAERGTGRRGGSSCLDIPPLTLSERGGGKRGKRSLMGFLDTDEAEARWEDLPGMSCPVPWREVAMQFRGQQAVQDRNASPRVRSNGARALGLGFVCVCVRALFSCLPDPPLSDPCLLNVRTADREQLVGARGWQGIVVRDDLAARRAVVPCDAQVDGQRGDRAGLRRAQRRAAGGARGVG